MPIIRNIMRKNPEPTSVKFDPDFNAWVMASRNGGGCEGRLMGVIAELFENSNVSEYYSKRQVFNACLEFGYFGYGNFAIYYIPQSNVSSLDLMKGEV